MFQDSIFRKILRALSITIKDREKFRIFKDKVNSDPTLKSNFQGLEKLLKQARADAERKAIEDPHFGNLYRHLRDTDF
jgi:hypothetical protein